MKRPPRTAPLAAALISAVAVAVLTLCTTLFLRSYRSAVVEAARTNSAQAVSQVVGAVGNYVSTMDSAVSIVMERLDDDTARPRRLFERVPHRPARGRSHHCLRCRRPAAGLLGARRAANPRMRFCGTFPLI